jgi:hypothetical protein
VTLVGLSKNHAMTFNHSATTRRSPGSGPDSYTTLLDATHIGEQHRHLLVLGSIDRR